MIPFAPFIRSLRLRRGLLQDQFAQIIGYEQGYVSALEIGTRGPPTVEFLAALRNKLALTADEQIELERVVRFSRRRFVLHHEASAETFQFINEVWEKIDRLHPLQLQLMWDVLRLPEQMEAQISLDAPRVRRRQKQEAKM